jgi:hypothetical protein
MRKFLFTDVAVDRVFEDLLPRFSEVPGNYTRIRKVGHRRGDKAEMAIIEYLDNPYMQYEEELANDLPKARLPGFTYKLL